MLENSECLKVVRLLMVFLKIRVAQSADLKHQIIPVIILDFDAPEISNLKIT